MKSNLAIAVVAVATTFVCTGCAALASSQSNSCSIMGDVQSASGTGTVTALVRNDTATLVGLVQSRVDANNAVKAAQNYGCVTKVYDRITVRN